METLAQRIKLIMKESGVTQAALASKIGVKQQTVQSICSGRIKRSRYTHEIAEKLGVNHEWLLSGAGDKWRQNEDGALQTPAVKYVPILHWEDALNWHAIKNTPNALREYTLFPVIGEISAVSFALKVTGDSMLSDDGYSIPDGSMVIVDPTKTPQHKSFVLVVIPATQEVVLRLLSIEGNKKYLKATNSSYPNSVTELPEDARILGVVAMTFRSFINFS